MYPVLNKLDVSVFRLFGGAMGGPSMGRTWPRVIFATSTETLVLKKAHSGESHPSQGAVLSESNETATAAGTTPEEIIVASEAVCVSER